MAAEAKKDIRDAKDFKDEKSLRSSAAHVPDVFDVP